MAERARSQTRREEQPSRGWTAWEGIVYHPPRGGALRTDRPGEGSMTKIFLSYRRGDSAGVAGRIYDRLRAHFGDDAIFMDIDSLPFGHDFREHIHSAVSHCAVLLAVIGPH